MAITSQGTIGSNQSKASGTTITITTSQAIPVNNVIVIIVASDNITTVSPVPNNVTITSGTNTFTPRSVIVPPNSAAGTSSQVNIFTCTVTQQINNAATITCTFGTAIVAKAITGWRFSTTVGLTYSSTSAYSSTYSTPAISVSLIDTSNSGVAWMAIRGFAKETPNSTVYTPTASWTAFTGNGTTGGGVASNMSVRGEFIISNIPSIGYTANSSPTYSGNNPTADAGFLLYEAGGTVIISSDHFGMMGIYGL